MTTSKVSELDSDKNERTTSTAIDVVDSLDITINDIGGIRQEERTISSGVTTLIGGNASKRTSFVQAILAGVGSRNKFITVNSDADDDDGYIEITAGDETYTRTVTDTSSGGVGGMVFSGEPVVEDEDMVEYLDLFAFLHGGNAVRQAIESGDTSDLYDVLMRPVDTEETQARIKRLNEREAELESKLEEIKKANREIDSYRLDKQEKSKKIQKKGDELEDIEADINSLSEVRDELMGRVGGSDRIEERISELEEKIDSLRETRSDLENDLEFKKEAIQETEEELAEIRNKFDPDRKDEISNEIQELEAKNDDLYRRIEELKQVRSGVQDLVDVTKMIRGSDRGDLFDNICDLIGSDDVPDGPAPITRIIGVSEPEVNGSNGGKNDDITDALLADAGNNVSDGARSSSASESDPCPVCGEVIETGRIPEVIDQYNEIIQRLSTRIREKQSDCDELQKQIETKEDERSKLQRRASEIERLKNQLESMREKRGAQRRELEEIEDKVASAKSDYDDLKAEMESGGDASDKLEEVQSELSKLRKQRSGLEKEIGRIETNREQALAKHNELQELIDQEDEVRKELEAVKAEKREARQEVRTLEQGICEKFNEYMEWVIDELGYKHLERVRLEVKRREGGDETTLRKDGKFELHIARESETGAMYEDTLLYLSESERAVTGLMVALSGFVAHDVAEICPMIVLDSIEMIDADRLAAILSFLHNRTGSRWNIVAMLPDQITDQTQRVIDQQARFTDTGDVVTQ